MKQTQNLNQVTPVSKILAAVLFVLLPFLGFYIGLQHNDSDSELRTLYNKCIETSQAVTTESTDLDTAN